MSNHNHQESIGVFDSGLGGLTVVRAVIKALPYENIVYFGDTANVPYGNKDPKTLLDYSLKNARFLINQNIKALIVACNTACTAALDTLRKTLDIPVIGIIEQGVDEVTHLYKEGSVAILATQATINSGVFEKKIHERSPFLTLHSIACPLLVSLIEEGFNAHQISEFAVMEYIEKLKNKNICAILLGCTHFPLLQHIIQEKVGSHVHLIDPSLACAKATQRLLAESRLLNTSKTAGTYQFFVSHNPEKFAILAENFLKFPIQPQLWNHEESVCIGLHLSDMFTERER